MIEINQGVLLFCQKVMFGLKSLSWLILFVKQVKIDQILDTWRNQTCAGIEEVRQVLAIEKFKWLRLTRGLAIKKI